MPRPYFILGGFLPYGGEETIQGILYQGFTAIFNALTVSEWDETFVEFPTQNEKVDIVLSVIIS